MKMTFRWYGEKDCIPLNHIKQIQGMTGVVTAVYDVPVGEVWPLERLQRLKALCDEVEYQLREEDAITANRTEGYQGGGWILVDFGDVIVHIFDSESREFFNLEKLWAAAEKIEFEAKED